MLGAKTLLWWYWLLAQEEVQSNGEEVCGSDDRSLLVGEVWGLEKLLMECEKTFLVSLFPKLQSVSHSLTASSLASYLEAHFEEPSSWVTSSIGTKEFVFKQTCITC